MARVAAIFFRTSYLELSEYLEEYENESPCSYVLYFFCFTTVKTV